MNVSDVNEAYQEALKVMQASVPDSIAREYIAMSQLVLVVLVTDAMATMNNSKDHDVAAELKRLCDETISFALDVREVFHLIGEGARGKTND